MFVTYVGSSKYVVKTRDLIITKRNQGPFGSLNFVEQINLI